MNRRHRIIAATAGAASAAAPPAFSPLDLAPTAWYDPSDLSTLFQDAAMTTPVTTDGDVIGAMMDKSGNGHHLTQGTTAAKPLYKTSAGVSWVQFDGADDSLSRANMTPGANDKMQLFCAANSATTAAIDCVIELSSTTDSNTGSFHFFYWDTGRVFYRSKGSAAGGTTSTNNTRLANTTYVWTALGDISGDSAILRQNGVQQFADVTDQGTGNYETDTLFIGRRNGTSSPYAGNVYPIILRFGAALTAGQISSAEAWVASKSGVTL